MNAFSLLIIFTLMAFFSMLMVSYANQKEKKRRILRQRLKSLRLRLDELEELVVELNPLVESKAITKAVNEEIIDSLNAMLKLDPSATYLTASLINAEQRMEGLNDETTTINLQRLKESDAKIARTQHYLTEAGKVIKRQQMANKLTLDEYNLFIFQLGWAHLMVDVISHIGQGHKAMNRSDILSAQAFYKRAQQTLVHSGHTDPRRHKMINELTEVLANQRQFLSLELMPESQYNPEPKAVDEPAATTDDENSAQAQKSTP